MSSTAGTTRRRVCAHPARAASIADFCSLENMCRPVRVDH
ncbi:hypothetical protein SXCC_00972 [Gluconacetobacter sp. SXCC-1]|nr:hypothetical protein SXCC_00972 [Gluconacetobacter sp. SXCC-1]